MLRDVEQQTTAEIAVVTVPSLDGMTVEEYASRLFKAWGIGKKGRDNGVLVLVAPTEHKMRIEVGYGLEAVLPDGLAGQIVRTECLPRFKEGDYAARPSRRRRARRGDRPRQPHADRRRAARDRRERSAAGAPDVRRSSPCSSRPASSPSASAGGSRRWRRWCSACSSAASR